MVALYDYIPSAVGGGATRPSCGGHSCSKDNCSSSHQCSDYTGGKKLTDATWVVSIQDSFDYNTGTTFIKDYELMENYSKQGLATWNGGTGSSRKLYPNANFMLYRQKDKDVVTLYPKKNEGLKEKLSQIGITAESYTPEGTRVAKESEKSKFFLNTFASHISDGGDRDTSLAWLWRIKGRGSHEESGEYNTHWETGHDPEQANSVYSKAGNVKENYLLGLTNRSELQPAQDIRDSWTNKYQSNKLWQRTSAEMSFYPYSKMIYRDKNDDANKQAVYVTSENLSTMKVYNAVQTGVYKKDAVNANLTSTQWSTHARSLKFLQGIGTDKKAVLPGGAILNLDLGSQGTTQVGIRLWQTCLEDSMVEAVQFTGFNTSLSKAREIADNYKTEVEATLAGYGLVQVGKQGVSTDILEVLNSGEELHENQSSSLVTGNAGKTSSDNKYYLRQDGSGSQRANFDVLDSRVEKQTVYTAKADVDGNIWVEKDGALLGVKSTKLSEVLANAEVKHLDENTRIVSNLYTALDRGLTDNNYDRYGENSYNEAFDGVSVLMTDLSFDIGFESASAQRSFVLDPLLLSKAESKSELYDFAEEKVRSSGFVTTKNSTTSADSTSGFIGELAGVLRNSLHGPVFSHISQINSYHL